METIITFNEIISPVPRVLIFISHSHFLLNLTKGYWGWQENNSGLLLLRDNKSGAQKVRTMPPSQRILYKLHSHRHDFMEANPIVFCSVFLGSQAPAVITPGTFSFVSCFLRVQGQGHAAELQVNQAVAWDSECKRSHVLLYTSALELLFEWICKQYNIMAECSDKTEKTHSEYFILGN